MGKPKGKGTKSVAYKAARKSVNKAKRFFVDKAKKLDERLAEIDRRNWIEAEETGSQYPWGGSKKSKRRTKRRKGRKSRSKRRTRKH